MFCGLELGHLYVIDFNMYKVVSMAKIGDKEERNHINSITKTAAKGLYVVGTNKGLALVKTYD
jgi:hypothetical protein